MLPNELTLTRFISFIKIPITPLTIITFLISILAFLFLNNFIFKNRMLTIIILLVFLLSTIYYFGFIPLLLFTIILVGSVFIGLKIFKFDDTLIALIVGFFTLLEIYIVIALLTNFSIALLSSIIISVASVIFRSGKNLIIFKKLQLDFDSYLKNFNVIDYWIIGLSFIIGTLPQSQWDAVHANLYNAKWYIINNSFKPLTESISSLFPQNAIGYYTLFYQIGGAKLLEMAYLFPLVALLLLIKNISSLLNFSKTACYLWYLIIFTPIVIFQASNGYYDLLVTLTLVAAFYLLFFQNVNRSITDTFSASFLIGFGAAIKYFPLVFIFLPIVSYIINKKNRIKNVIAVSLISILLSLLPLTIWMIRSFFYTGSPIFPFFQSIFQTPVFWAGEELTNNFMIQTTMNSTGWIKGGFILYPILTFFKTTEFMEATRGYPGLVYILLIPVQFAILLLIIKRILSKSIEKRDIFYLYIFFSYFMIGLISRYYRYLWPFQFVFASITFFYIIEWIDRLKAKKLVTGIIFFVILLNVNVMVIYFRFFPIGPEKLFQPDFYTTRKSQKNPISFLNKETKNNKSLTILDTSFNKLPRFNFIAKTYECNWYWIGGVNEFLKTNKNQNLTKQLFKKFNYIITSNPITDSNNFCYQTINNNKSLLKQIYSDNNYLIFKIR